MVGSIEEEIENVRESFPKVHIETATNDFLSGWYGRTASTLIKFTLTFREGYPDNAVIVDIKSDLIVPSGLKKKLEKDLAKDLPIGTHEQVILIIQRLVQFVDCNKFLPCWKELKQSINLVQSTNSKASVSLIESKGKIRLKLCHGDYFYHCTVTIDDGYPITKTHENWGKACLISMNSTNFPPKIEKMLTSQAQELVRRMQDGMSPEQALQMSNPIRLPPNFQESKIEKVKVRLTHEALKSLKVDADALSRTRDLRNINTATKQGDARVKEFSAKERKDARRAINKLAQTEKGKDIALEEKDRQWQLEEKNRLAGYGISEHDDTNPQPSLLSLVSFLVTKIQNLPEEICPSCGELTLPSDPEKLKLLFKPSSECKNEKEKKERKAARAMRPIRTYDGRWYHYKCLDKFMTEPPFGLNESGRRIYHPDWPDDFKQRERTWASQQARLREIEDAAMFL